MIMALSAASVVLLGPSQQTHSLFTMASPASETFRVGMVKTGLAHRPGKNHNCRQREGTAGLLMLVVANNLATTALGWIITPGVRGSRGNHENLKSLRSQFSFKPLAFQICKVRTGTVYTELPGFAVSEVRFHAVPEMRDMRSKHGNPRLIPKIIIGTIS